jgi:hypothetical protein
MVLRITLFLLLLAGLILPDSSAAERPSRWHAMWRASQALLAASDAADIASSWGKNEANPLVRSGQRFSYGSAAIKLGALAGGLAAQHYIARKYPEEKSLMASVNLAAAGALGVVAARNMQVPPAPR